MKRRAALSLHTAAMARRPGISCGEEEGGGGWKKPNTTPPRSSPRLLALALAAFVSACATPPETALPQLTPEAERIFHADPRWLGGDAAISVDLGHDRILWLFGDSFVDPAPPYARREAAFPRNTIAVQERRDGRTARMTFVWRSEGGAPSAFFPGTKSEWYWPGSGTVLPDGTLAVFLHRLRATDAAPPLGFESAGYALALIANPDDPPAAWHGRIVPGPDLPFDAVPGAALVRDGDAVTVLATRTGGTPAGMLVRYAAADLAAGNLGKATWWSGTAFVAASALPKGGPAVVIADAGAESSLQATPCGYLHVASLGFGASVIAARTAPSIAGPWSEPATLLTPPESATARPFVYAGRAHPALPAPAGALTVSWVANSFAPEALLTPEGGRDLYWPRLAVVAAPACPR